MKSIGNTLKNIFRAKIDHKIVEIILLTMLIVVAPAGAKVPVTYSCCINYTDSDGAQLDTFENIPLGGNQLSNFEDTSATGVRLDNFENLSNWTVGGSGASQMADTVNFKEGTQALKLIAVNGNAAYIDKTINNDFLAVNNFKIWLYIPDKTNFSLFRIYLTSNGSKWLKYYSYNQYTVSQGWNNIIVDKSSFNNTGGEDWNNIMNRVRIAIYPKAATNINITFDDLKDNVSSDWTIGGTGASLQPDTVNYIEGTQGLKISATNGNTAYIDKVINNDFSGGKSFGIWLYVPDKTTLSFFRIYFTSTGSKWSKDLYYSVYGGFKSGWNKIIFDKASFISENGEDWNNVMNRIRIYVYPIAGGNTAVTVDDLRYDVTYDWVAGGTGSSISPDTINFKEGKQGLKLIATSGNSAYIDKAVSKDFSQTNNFEVWVYVDNASASSYIRLYLTSNGSNWSTFFYDSEYGGVKSGWNRLIFNRHNFMNVGGESWNNVMNKIRLRIGPFGVADSSVTFDDLRYDMTGKRAKLIIDIDDGELSTYTKVFPILNKNSQPAVSFVVTSYVGDPYSGSMDLNQLKALQSAGWDISSHTIDHPDLTLLSESGQISEINDSFDWLVDNKFQKSAGFIAYPYGKFNDGILDKVKRRYVLGRGTIVESAQQHFTQSDDAIQYIQRITSVHNDTSVQFVKDYLDDVINNRLLGILMFHHVADTNPDNDKYTYLTTDFQSISDYIKSRSSDMDVITYSDYVIPNIYGYTPVINKTTRIFSNGSVVLITKNKYDEYMPNMTVRPLSDSIDINLTLFDEVGSLGLGLVKFNESSPNRNLQVYYNIGDRKPNQAYRVKIYWANGTIYQDFITLSDNNGHIMYNSAGFEDARYEEISKSDILPLSMTSSIPTTDPVTVQGVVQKFNITLNKMADVTWYINSALVQTNSSVVSANYSVASDIGAYNVTVVAKDGYYSVSRIWNWNVINVVPIVQGSAPSITVQPISQTKMVGESVTFSVLASGTDPLYYQWTKNSGIIVGATSTSYTIASISVSDAGSYGVIVTNSYGSATSNSAILTVNSINQQNGAGTPKIISYSPSSTIVNGRVGSIQSFMISLNQTVNVDWFINGTRVYNQSGVTTSTYNNNSAVLGKWNISVVARNINGSDSHIWTWNVTKNRPRIVKGDINDNGFLDVADGIYTLQAVAGVRTLTPAQITLADINQNGVLDLIDGLFILQSVAGVRTL